MRYSQTVRLNEAIPGLDEFIFRGNSIYDPEVALGGSSAYGFNQWEPFYQRYYVAASKIRIRAVNMSTSSCAYIQVIPSNIASVAATSERETEFKYSKWRFLGPRDGGANSGTVKHYMTTQKLTGRRGTDIEANYTGEIGPGTSTGSDPITVWFWSVIGQDALGTAAVDLHVDCQLTYYVKLFNRPVITNS